MQYTHQDTFKQTINAPIENREAMVELARSKTKLRKVEEFVRKFETFTDARGFMATRILEILEDKDA